MPMRGNNNRLYGRGVDHQKRCFSLTYLFDFLSGPLVVTLIEQVLLLANFDSR
jgi:hypothetical protein